MRSPRVHARPSFAPVGPLAVRVAARSVCFCRVLRFRVMSVVHVYSSASRNRRSVHSPYEWPHPWRRPIHSPYEWRPGPYISPRVPFTFVPCVPTDPLAVRVAAFGFLPGTTGFCPVLAPMSTLTSRDVELFMRACARVPLLHACLASVSRVCRPHVCSVSVLVCHVHVRINRYEHACTYIYIQGTVP